MAKIAFILPREDMIPTARELAAQYGLDVVCIEAVRVPAVEEQARQAIAAGADILVARGGQARMIRDAFPQPVVEIRLTALEIAILVRQAIALAGKPCPRVGLVGSAGMFSDVSRVKELCDAQLCCYTMQIPWDMEQVTQQAIDDGVDVLISGEDSCAYAQARGVPTVFLAAGRESMEDACRNAQRMAYAVDQQRKDSADFRAILEYTFSGILHIDRQGRILHINRAAEQLLKQTEEKAQNQPIWTLLPVFSQEMLRPVLDEGRELYALHLQWNKRRLLVSVAPILQDTVCSGAILSINEADPQDAFDAETRNRLRLAGHVANMHFDQLEACAPSLKPLLEQAKLAARLRTPVLICGEFGTEKAELAQCIHNASELASGTFASFDCSAYSPEEADQQLFGPDGLVRTTQGTLFLNNVSQLPILQQNKLCRYLAPERVSSFGSWNERRSRLRIIAADSANLSELAHSDAFSLELYFALRILSLTIPPLRERPKDIQTWGEFFFKSLQKSHGRYIRLNQDAWKLMRESRWSGNLTQLYAMCERLVVLSPRRNIDAATYQQQLPYFGTKPHYAKTGEDLPELKAQQIRELLQKHDGSRVAVARELGISKTTLWRYMKKYQL